MVTVYDTHFNQNEWFILALLALGILLLVFLPKRFPLYHAVCYFLFGIFSSNFFDHAISIRPFDFYDVNDMSRYQWMDFLSYVMYGPLSYLHIYLFDRFKIQPKDIPAYALLMAAAAVGLEFAAVLMGVYHYKNGYRLAYSFPIYLFTESLLLMLYYRLEKRRNRSGGKPVG